MRSFSLLLKVCTVFCFILTTCYLHAQDSISVHFNKTQFNQKDTVSFSCDYISKSGNKPTASVHLIVQEITGNRQWHFRYPMIDGKANGSLAINDSISSGEYIFNFAVQPDFLRIKGIAENLDKKEKSINYTLMGKQSGSITDEIGVAPDGTFKLPKLNFTDTVYVIFSPVKQHSVSPLNITLETPLDSFFLVTISSFQTIIVGEHPAKETTSDSLKKTIIKENISKNLFVKDATLPGVTVNTIGKSKVDQFNEEYSTGLFKGRNNVRIFDGLESTKIATSFDLGSFLLNNIAGFTVPPRRNLGGGQINFRGGGIDYYVDEVKMQSFEDASLIPTANIAMIKFYPAPSYLTLSFNKTAVVIYTKKGKWAEESASVSGKRKFSVVGYTAENADWK